MKLLYGFLPLVRCSGRRWSSCRKCWQLLVRKSCRPGRQCRSSGSHLCKPPPSLGGQGSWLQNQDHDEYKSTASALWALFTQNEICGRLVGIKYTCCFVEPYGHPVTNIIFYLGPRNISVASAVGNVHAVHVVVGHGALGQVEISRSPTVTKKKHWNNSLSEEGCLYFNKLNSQCTLHAVQHYL